MDRIVPAIVFGIANQKLEEAGDSSQASVNGAGFQTLLALSLDEAVNRLGGDFLR
jgi:hypothetical protein